MLRGGQNKNLKIEPFNGSVKNSIVKKTNAKAFIAFIDLDILTQSPLHEQLVEIDITKAYTAAFRRY